MYIVVEIMWKVQKYCTGVVGMVIDTGYSKKVATANTYTGHCWYICALC